MVLGSGSPVVGSSIAIDAVAPPSSRPFDRTGIASAAKLDDLIHSVSRIAGIAALATTLTLGANFLL